jgi:hypothetical protein
VGADAGPTHSRQTQQQRATQDTTAANATAVTLDRRETRDERGRTARHVRYGPDNRTLQTRSRLPNPLTLAIDPIEMHRFGLAGRESLILMLGASLLTFFVTRGYTRLARVRGWRSGHVGDVHVHHLVAGIVLTLISGMVEIGLQPGDFGRELLAIGFGIGAAFILDEFALSVHLRDVYWTPEGRHSIEVMIMWVLLGLLLLVGISPFGIHDRSEVPRIVGFVVVAVNIVLSAVTCLKGKPTLALLSIFLPPVGLVAAVRLGRPGSIWAQLFYRTSPKLRVAAARFDPSTSRLEQARHRLSDLLGGDHDGASTSSRAPVGATPREPTEP